MYDLTIIGGGPAGISAAIYGVRKGLKILIITKELSGRLSKISLIENYPGFSSISGEELAKKLENHLKRFKFDFQENEVLKISKKGANFVVETKSGNYQSKTILITTGAKPRTLNVPGEEKYRNKGIAYCATCDAPLFYKKDVAVIGGGNSALEAVIQLIGIANKVYLINRSGPRGDKVLLDKIKKSSKVEILNNTTIKEITGVQLVQNVKIETEGIAKEIRLQGIFVNIGYNPDTEIVKDLVKLNLSGEIEIDSKNQTSVSGIFAAGDCTNIPHKQAIIAAGEGAKAALSAFKYLSRM